MFSADLQNIGAKRVLPQLSGLTFSTDHVDDVRSHMSSVLYPHTIHAHGCGQLNFRHHQGRLKNICFNAVDYGTSKGQVTVGVPPMESSYLMHFSLAGSCDVEMGDEKVHVPTGSFTVLSPFEHLRVGMSWDHLQLSVRVPRELLEQILGQEIGFRPNTPVLFKPKAYPSQTGSYALRRIVETICSDFSDGIPGVTHARVAASLEDCFVRLMLATLDHSYSADINALDQAPPPAPYYIRRAEQYIRANATETITIADLVQASGVSTRSLHAGFKRFRRTSPMTYLRNYRLDLARDALLAAARRDKSVTDVALDCGFNHLSKFARDYHLRFGEKPSETRRQGALSN
ncbi:MAG: AraC family transcriptional regulator [Pseudomonadota bacterium]